MNVTVNLSRSVCPQFAQTASKLIQDQYPKNLTFDDKSDELAWYACQYGLLVDLLNRTNRYGAIAKWLAFCFGFFGSISAVITFTRKEYTSCVTMMYHRSINAVEIFTSLLSLQSALHSVYTDQLLKYRIWAYFTVYLAEKLRNCLFLWVNLIVLWVAIERILACTFPRIFDKINRKSVSTMVITTAGLVGFTIFLPYGFSIDLMFNNKTQSYVIVKSAWAQSQSGGYKEYSLALSILMICHATLLLLASLIALRGLMAMTKRKKGLAASCGSNKSEASRELLRQCSLNIQLCILQMCETVPCIANELLFVFIIVRYDFMSPFKATAAQAPEKLSYSEAMAMAARMVPYLYFGMVNGIGVLISHYGRFYWYLLFSPTVRKSCWAMLTRSTNRVQSTNTNIPTTITRNINTTGNAVTHC